MRGKVEIPSDRRSQPVKNPRGKKNESLWEPIELGEMCCKLWATVLTTHVFFLYRNLDIRTQSFKMVILW